ncbi:MAG: NAD(+) synthase [Clostridia bacterium]
MESEIKQRVDWIKEVLKNAHANGVVVGNSGGKDCTLVEILCKKATENVLSVIMPCESKRNYEIDKRHALLVAEKYNIETIEVDITSTKQDLARKLEQFCPKQQVPMAYANMNPRLRMTTLYTIAQNKNYLVAGTGNLSEITMGYFTKWGDGGYDFNPIADMTATEVFAMLRYLQAPIEIIEKAPSAGLYEGQTDEKEMGVSYAEIDKFIRTGESEKQDVILKAFNRNQHKRVMPLQFKKQ